MNTRTLAPLAAAVLALSLSACSGSSAGTATSDTASDTAQGSTPSAGAPGGDVGGMGGPGGLPGATGEVAAVQGDVVQVQGAQGQVAVTLTGSTSITTQVASSLDEVQVGSCVIVTGSDSGEDSVVRVSDPVDGECAGGFGGGFGGGSPGGERPSELPSEMPSDMPSDMPSGAPEGISERGDLVVGEVTAVDDSSITVASVEMAPPGEEADEPATTEVAVEVTAGTTFTATVAGTAADVTVGRCLSAQGEADDTGAVTAETASVTDKVDGECTSGRGGFGGMPGGAPTGESGDAS